MVSRLPHVQLLGVEKRFGETVVVRGIDLAIESGEFFTLLGPSGSGKTTTLRMLAGLEAVSSGEILIGGRPVTTVPPEKRDIGLVFQQYALFPHLTVFDNVAFPLRMRRVDREEIGRRVIATLAMTEMERFATKYPRQLSGGQQQRVALARASVSEPKILLMDEPLGALDRRLRDHMRIELKILQKRTGATVLYVTHDQEEALSMSDRIGVMRDGRLEQVGPPSELYERPANAFVATFLGDAVAFPAQRLGRDSDRLILNVDSLRSKVRLVAEKDLCHGDSGVLVIRPERLMVSVDEPPAIQENRVFGKMIAAAYLGDHVEVIVANEAGARMVAHCSSLSGALTVGKNCWVSWQLADACFVDGATSDAGASPIGNAQKVEVAV
jgi:putative spermidine/putrescine transport system ATP-binding protein